MSEKFLHRELKQKAKTTLLSEGFTEDQILIDKYCFKVEGIRHEFRCDAYASNGTAEKAIECGNWPIWKRDFYYKRFGKENVRHFPFPQTYGRYLQIDVKENRLDSGQAKQFMIDTYKQYIYEEFKGDSEFNFLEFTEENKKSFVCGPHGKTFEYNPDFCVADKAELPRIWMNFPTSSLDTREDYMNKIH